MNKAALDIYKGKLGELNQLARAEEKKESVSHISFFCGHNVIKCYFICQKKPHVESNHHSRFTRD